MRSYQFVVVLIAVTSLHGADARFNRDFGGAYDNFAAMSAKLDTFIASLDKVEKELQTLNDAYRRMRPDQSKLVKIPDSEDAGQAYAEPEFLLSAAVNSDWNSRVYCEASEAETHVEMRSGEQTEIKRIFCPTVNTFLAAVQHAESGHITGICCERKKSRRKG